MSRLRLPDWQEAPGLHGIQITCFNCKAKFTVRQCVAAHRWVPGGCLGCFPTREKFYYTYCPTIGCARRIEVSEL